MLCDYLWFPVSHMFLTGLMLNDCGLILNDFSVNIDRAGAGIKKFIVIYIPFSEENGWDAFGFL